MRTKIIVNTTAGRGRAGRMLDQVKSCLAQQGVEGDYVFTEGPGDGYALALAAANAGYERVVAVGGDGTVNEVANGLLAAADEGKKVVLGMIPAGSGNDFAYGVGFVDGVAQACQRLAQGGVRSIDVIRVTVDGETRFFDNNVGIGYDADVLLETRKVKRLRGFLLYLWGVFRVWIAPSRWPYPVSITVDGQRLPHENVTLVSIANGPRDGGAFFLAPDAMVDDGLFDVAVADRVGRLQILWLLPKVLNGSHVDAKPVTMLKAKHVLIEGKRGLPGHIDGEVLCTEGRRFEFEILPGRLEVWC